MNTNLSCREWINKNIPYKLRKKGLQIFYDPNIIYEDKLLELYKLGQDSRNEEVCGLKLQLDALERAFIRPVNFVVQREHVQWWWAVVVLVIAATHFYFTYVH